MAWSTINTISKPCKCGVGVLESVHFTDGNGNYHTEWNLICESCNSKYNIVESSLVGNPDKTLSIVKYVPKGLVTDANKVA